MRMLKCLLTILLAGSLFSCAGKFGRLGLGGEGASGAATKIPEELRSAETVAIAVSRDKLIESLKTKKRNSVRMISVFRKGIAFPEYHLFDVQDKSIYTLLGMQSRDTVIAADDYVIAEPRQFMAFLQVLPNEKSASIRLRRDERELRMEYTIQ